MSGALRVVLVVDVVGTLAWALVLGLFVDWTLAWKIALGSGVYGFVLLGALVQFAQVQAARGAAESADDLDSDGQDDAPTRGVQ